MRLAEIKEKQGTLERQLERDVAKSTTLKSPLQQGIIADEVEDGRDDERDLEATPLVALDLTYEDDADSGADDIIDLGVQIGKMRITERIGGLSRPRIAEEVNQLALISQTRIGLIQNIRYWPVSHNIPQVTHPKISRVICLDVRTSRMACQMGHYRTS